MNNITIANGWHDLNTGDSAIIIGMIKQLKKNASNFNINIVSELCDKNEYFNHSIDYIKKSFPDIKINLIGSCFYKVYNKGKVKEALSLVYNYLLISLPSFILKKIAIKNNYYKTINESKFVLSKGGHFIFDRKGLKGTIHLFKCLYPLRVAKKLGIPYYIISQSIGPLNNSSKSIFSKISYNMCHNILKNANKISLRETVSYDNLAKLGLADNANNTGDYAFVLDNIGNDKLPTKLKNIIKNKNFVIFTLRQHDFKKKEGEDEYIDTIENIANYINQKYQYKIVFVSHVNGPNDFENDRIIIDKITSKFNNNDFIYVKEQFTPQELFQFYSNSKLMIGTRFHSVIFALANYVPAIAISYSGYKANIMKQFDLDNFMINIEEVNPDNELKIKNMIDELLKNREKYSKQIKKYKKEVINMIDNDEAFKDALSNIK